MRLPIRSHATPRAAPMGPLPASAGLGTSQQMLAQYLPQALGAVVGTTPTGKPIRVPIGLVLRAPRFHPGWWLASVIAGMVAKEASNYLLMVMSGLRFQRFCSPAAITGWIGPASIDGCLDLQAEFGYPMRMLPGYIRANAQYWYQPYFFHMMGNGLVVGLPPNQSQRAKSVFVMWHPGNSAANRAPYYARHVWVNPAIPSYVEGRWSRPGFVPRVTRPWPVWSGPRPWTDPAPTPRAADYPDLGADPSYWEGRNRIPPTRWEWEKPQAPPVVKPIVQAPAVPRVEAPTMTQERKFGASTLAGQVFFSVMKARELVSEYEDFLDVLYKSLPAKVRRSYGGSGASTVQKMAAVYENADSIDAGLFFRNFIANHIEDEIIGRTWFKMRGALRNALFGNSMGSTGPVSNPLFDRYAKEVSDLSGDLADLVTQDRFNSYERDRAVSAFIERWKKKALTVLREQP